MDIEECLGACREVHDCTFVAVGTGKKAGRCFWQLGQCAEFEADSYDVYTVSSGETEAPNSASSRQPLQEDMERSGVFAEVRPAEISVDADSEADIDLLITEEGWGLSSANWLIRRSEWSIDFLDRAFRLCHEEMPLFGDQDAMIHLLLNAPALDGRSGSRAVDPHAALIPQHEINAYDALNAHYMQADAYTDGDLLITFPGCKEARSCNPLFRLAAAHGRGEQRDAGEQHMWPYMR
eukprot:CAMPEP_0176141538 /NCGR_PEP_ID=MMETSP0120_2-20121206/71976_1 /TAXON_ID=160619 /ORGANISM="Kryptoperidinium foliaceum, Strain CCMP 1326" /LENGTH=236 /DNA_ID=CAMNT_0017477685 /DNA_START=77 /DNA_END=783 /DNA_ORIENTATION=+